MSKTSLFYIISAFSLFSSPLAAEVHKPQQFLEKIAGKSDEGAQIVSHYCANCHGQAPLIPLGAPVAGDKKVWKLRLNQPFDNIFAHADAGFNAMPARGGCFECSDAQLLLAILALMPKNEQKALLEKAKDSKKYNELKKYIEKTKLLQNSPDN